jgi:hypothetical protein
MLPMMGCGERIVDGISRNPAPSGKGTMMSFESGLCPDAEQLLRGLAEKEERDGYSDSYSIDQILEVVGFGDRERLEKAVDNLDFYFREHGAVWGDGEPVLSIECGRLTCGVRAVEAWEWCTKHANGVSDDAVVGVSSSE